MILYHETWQLCKFNNYEKNSEGPVEKYYYYLSKLWDKFGNNHIWINVVLTITQ